jgi:glucan phosphoethanolaminetransferase (alkaline phosphatase superfamily)
MRSLLRPTNIIVLISYLLLSAVPFLPLLFGRPVEHASQIVSIEFVTWVAIWAIFKRPAWFHLLLLPAFVALPVELYLQTYYGQGISTHHLGIIAETSPKETAEFLGNKIWLLGGVMVGVVAWWGMVWKAAFKTRALDWQDISRWIVLVLLAGATAVWFYGREFGVMPPHVVVSASGSGSASSASDTEEEVDEDSSPAAASADASGKPHEFWSTWPKLPRWAKVPFELSSFGPTWPFGLVMHGYDYWQERTYLAELKFKSKSFLFGTHQVDPVAGPQLVVLVIGESSRYDRWSLNGYERETNPLLKQETNLVSLSDVVTSVSATRLSVPVMVSRKPATQSLKAGFAEKSVLSAFKEAGFKTYWLSNQMSFGQFDTPVSVYANEADVTQFLNLGGFTNNSNLDSVLLEPLKNAMADPAEKKLIVLHTLGNHWNYSHRYPPEFDRWKPSLFGVKNPAYTDLKIKADINNSYDNSILYTDWFLEQVISDLRDSGQFASMMYIADHGQTLYDGSCNLAFHGHNTQYEFHVPALVWYSDLYKAHYPEKVERLLRNRNAKLATENVFHSLLDMSDLRYASEHLEWSLFSSQFKRHKRYVDSYGWTDYDNSTFKGDCREVMDKGKPLVQEK